MLSNIKNNIYQTKVGKIIPRLLEFNVNTGYLALITYFYLSMFQIAPVFKMLIALSTMIKHLGFQCLTTFLLSVSCIIYYRFFPFFDNQAVYIVLFIILLLYIEYKKVKPQNYDNHMALLLFSMLANTIIDISMKFGWLGFYSTYIECQFPSTIFRLASIYIVVHLIMFLNTFIKNHKISSLIVFNGIFLLNAIHYWTLAITNKAFLLKDVLLFKTVLTVLNGVQLEIADILYFLIYIVLIVIFNILLHKHRWRAVKRRENLKILLTATLYLIFLIMLLHSRILGHTTYKAYMKYGFVSSLITGTEVNKEPSYYKGFLSELPFESEIKCDAEKINVIIIMNEAFSDLSVIGDFETNQDYMPYTRELMKNIPSGYLYSSVYGNNTASSEYECLTGVPTALTKTGGELYQFHMNSKKESLVSYFKSLGYKTTGIHPYDGEGYNRKAAWEKFGFDRMLFQDDFEKTEKIRDYISDQSFYEKVIEEYEATSSPKFIFGISMQNHATYLSDFKGDITLEDMDYEDVEEYLSLIKMTDNANKYLIDYFSKKSEKTMIVFFGDHHPMINPDFYTEVMQQDFYELEGKEQSLIYKIPYFIWTNYEDAPSVPEEISINYLPYVIVDKLGYPKTKWYEFLGETMETFPVITTNFFKVSNQYIPTEKIIEQTDGITVKDVKEKYYVVKRYQVWSYDKAVRSKEE